MATITAALMLSENNWTTSDFGGAASAATTIEYLIDNAVDFTNLECGTSISNMSGVAGSKTLTVTGNQSATLKPLIILLMRGYLDRGPNANVESLSITTLLSDPQYALQSDLIKIAWNRLRGMSFERT